MIDAEFVEKALLGTLLNDPTRRAQVPWLEVTDFTNPLCRALWAHLEQGAPSDFSYPLDYVRLSEALHTEADIHPRLTWPSEIAGLQVQAPVHPDAAAYGRILVEVAIRNQIVDMGFTLGSADGRTGPHDREEPAAAIEALQELQNRWQQIDTPPPTTSVDNSQDLPRRPTSEPGSRRPNDPQIGLPNHHLVAAESAVLGSAVHDLPPGSRSRLVALIHPRDFSDPRVAATFQAVRDLASRTDHVDEITVQWQVMRNQSTWGPGLPLAELARDHFTGQRDPHDIETVTGAAQRRAMLRASVTVTSEAQDLALDLSTTTARASESLNEVVRARTKAASAISKSFGLEWSSTVRTPMRP